MSEATFLLSKTPDKRQRALALALELIETSLSQDIGSNSTTGNNLESHLNKLSSYVDKIEAELKKGESN